MKNTRLEDTIGSCPKKITGKQIGFNRNKIKPGFFNRKFLLRYFQNC